jgi:hypothetical protein
MTSIDRMIAEIESYLKTPIKDAQSVWEHDERRSLRDLLEQLKREKAKTE